MGAKEIAVKKYVVKKYVVKLDGEERKRLELMIRSGKPPAQRLMKARILLKADASDSGEGWNDSQIAKALDTSLATIARTRQQLVEEGFEAVLTRKHSPASARKRVFDGAAEAKLTALACSAPPTGRVRWTLRMLEDKVVELIIVERVSDNTIGRTQKNLLKPHLKEQWVIAPDASAALVAAMEDVLEVYHRPHDPTCPVVSPDETSKQLISETRQPIPQKPGRLGRHDYEYARNGTANLFILFAPLERWRLSR